MYLTKLKLFLFNNKIKDDGAEIIINIILVQLLYLNELTLKILINQITKIIIKYKEFRKILKILISVLNKIL